MRSLGIQPAKTGQQGSVMVEIKLFELEETQS